MSKWIPFFLTMFLTQSALAESPNDNGYCEGILTGQGYDRVGDYYFKHLYDSSVRLNHDELTKIFGLYHRAKITSRAVVPVLSEEESELIKRIANFDVSVGRFIAVQRVEKILFSGLFKLAIKAGNLYRESFPRATNQEITQSVMTGFMSAVEDFDPKQGYMFSTLAYRYVYSQLMRDMDISQGPIRAVKRGDSRFLKVMHYKSILETIQSGRQATAAEIAGYYNSLEEHPVDVLEVERNLEKSRVLNGIHSTTAKLMITNEDDLFSDFYENIRTIDFLEDGRLDPFEELFHSQMSSVLMRILSEGLNRRESEVVMLRMSFGENMRDMGMTLEEVGRLVGLTRERVRQIEREAMKKLKRRLMRQPEKAEILKHIGPFIYTDQGILWRMPMRSFFIDPGA